MNTSSLRRFVLTLLTGYLAIFGVRRLPYQFENEWLILLPVLVLVYVLTTWFDSKVFARDSIASSQLKQQISNRSTKSKKGFG